MNNGLLSLRALQRADGWIDGWKGVCMNRGMDIWMDARVDECRDGCMYIWMDAWMDESSDDRLNGWRDTCMYEHMSMCECTHACIMGIGIN